MEQVTLTPPLINFKQERSFSQKLNATFAFLSQNFRPMAKSLLFIAGPFVVLVGLCYGILPSFLLNTTFSTQNPFQASGFQPLLMGAILGIFLFSLVAGTLVITIVLRHIRTYVEQGHTNITPGNLWKTIWKDFFGVMGTSIFIVVALFGAWIMITMAGAMFMAIVSHFAMIILVFIAQTIGFVCTYSALLLLYPIRFVERKNVFSALSRMLRLNSGKWLSTAGLMVVTFIIQLVVTFAFVLPMYLLTFIQMFHLSEKEVAGIANDSVSIFFSILYSIAGVIFIAGSFGMSSLLLIASSFQYYSLLERKEAKGLLERMEDFGKPKTETDDQEEKY